MTFGGTPAGFGNVTRLSLTAIVPSGAVSGRITVSSPGGSATSGLVFGIPGSAVPVISAFSPGNGPVGTMVTLIGTDLVGVRSVTFGGGVPAAFTASMDGTRLSTTVPQSAVDGPITVVTAAGSASTPGSFTVGFLGPRIDSFSPTSGPPGTVVTINGVVLWNMGSVTFNGVMAASVSVSTCRCQVTATVPEGATTGPIEITATAGVATSGAPFTVTAP